MVTRSMMLEPVVASCKSSESYCDDHARFDPEMFLRLLMVTGSATNILEALQTGCCSSDGLVQKSCEKM